MGSDHTPRGLLTAGLPLALGLALAVASCKKVEPEPSKGTAALGTSSASAVANAIEAESVVVYYFHGNRRCRTCMGIQEAITKTIREQFAAETASGKLTFREINIDQPENAHYVKDFDLSFSSMVVAANQGSHTVQWQNCKEVWPLAHDEAKLQTYAAAQIRNYLGLVRSS